MKNIGFIIAGILALAVLFLLSKRKAVAPKINIKAYLDTIVEQRKLILLSQWRIHEERKQDSIKTIAIHEFEVKKAQHEVELMKRIADLEKASKTKIDSLLTAFYPDTARRNREIVITHERAEACDSIKTNLEHEVAAYADKTVALERQVKEFETVQIPALQKIDSAHQKIEIGLTDQVRKAKGRRFTLGPSLSIGIDGMVRPGISVGWALIKF
jgi:hypothetical protein